MLLRFIFERFLVVFFRGFFGKVFGIVFRVYSVDDGSWGMVVGRILNRFIQNIVLHFYNFYKFYKFL